MLVLAIDFRLLCNRCCDSWYTWHVWSIRKYTNLWIVTHCENNHCGPVIWRPPEEREIRGSNNNNNNNNNKRISRAPFPVKHAQLRWTDANTKTRNAWNPTFHGRVIPWLLLRSRPCQAAVCRSVSTAAIPWQQWFSSGNSARRLAVQGECEDWLARCQYTVTGWEGKFDQQVLS